MQGLWNQIHELFDTDDGSLPDIFVEGLLVHQVRTIYHWVCSHSQLYCKDGEPTLWDRKQEEDVPITTIEDPAQLVIDGDAEPFRHGLSKLVVSGIELPQLTIAVYQDSIEFDYKMGSEWGPEKLTALFNFLWEIQKLAPNAKISHADEGASVRSASFADAWEKFRTDQE